MAYSFQQLPGYEMPRNALLDLAPINSAIDQKVALDQQAMRNKFQDRQIGLQERQVSRAEKNDEADKMGKRAIAIAGLPPEQRAIAWPKTLAMHPNKDSLPAEYLDPIKGPAMVAAEYGQFRDPKADELKGAEINLKNAQAANIGTTDDIREFNFAKQNGYGGSFSDWQTVKRDTGKKFGLVPIPFQKEDGSTGYMVPSNQGDTRELSVPGSGKILSPVTTVQTPTQTISRDKYGREISREDKDLAGAEAAKRAGQITGEATAQARINLPAAENAANRLRKQMDEIYNDPGLPSVTGVVGGRLGPRGLTTEKMADTQSKIDQVKAGTFLQAYNDLRGAGAISNAEGEGASKAYNRLTTQTMGTAAYKKALDEFRGEVDNLVELARRKAQGGGVPQPTPSGDGGWSIVRRP